jgi:hypothetical protein
MKNKFEIHEKDKNGFKIIYKTDKKSLVDCFIKEAIENKHDVSNLYLKSHLFEPAMLNLEYFK